MKILLVILVSLAVLFAVSIIGSFLPSSKWVTTTDLTVWTVMFVLCAAGAYYLNKRIKE